MPTLAQTLHARADEQHGPKIERLEQKLHKESKHIPQSRRETLLAQVSKNYLLWKQRFEKTAEEGEYACSVSVDFGRTAAEEALIIAELLALFQADGFVCDVGTPLEAVLQQTDTTTRNILVRW